MELCQRAFLKAEEIELAMLRTVPTPVQEAVADWVESCYVSVKSSPHTEIMSGTCVWPGPPYKLTYPGFQKPIHAMLGS